MAGLLICTAFLFRLTVGYLELNYPLNLQLPPVARVDAPFSYQLSPTTFLSDSNTVQYSLIGPLSCLSFDGNSRTLSGTPHTKDAGAISFTITATGEPVSAATIASTLLVSSDDGPNTKDNISAVLSAGGQLSEPGSIVLKPVKPFNISFLLDTFETSGKKLNYTALLSDHTPLPAWISFDASLHRFTGTAPQTGSSQSFEILLLASDTTGYSTSLITFTMVISNHLLSFKPLYQTVDVAVGDQVHLADLKEKLFLDDQPIEDSQFQFMTADLPPWLTFDNTTLEILGRRRRALFRKTLLLAPKISLGMSPNTSFISM